MKKTIFNKLPMEARDQILNTYCVDNDKEISDLTQEEVVSEVKWCIERMKMDISESNNVPSAKRTIKACERFLLNNK